MARYRKRPLVIEAERVTVLLEQAFRDREALPDWVRAAEERGDVVLRRGGLDVRTREGTMRARPADWLICGLAGELYPCTAAIFRATYEPVAWDGPLTAAEAAEGTDSILDRLARRGG